MMAFAYENLRSYTKGLLCEVVYIDKEMTETEKQRVQFWNRYDELCATVRAIRCNQCWVPSYKLRKHDLECLCECIASVAGTGVCKKPSISSAD